MYLRNVALLLPATATGTAYLVKNAIIPPENTQHLIMFIFYAVFPVFGLSLFLRFENKCHNGKTSGFFNRSFVIPIKEIIYGIKATPKLYLGISVFLLINGYVFISEIGSVGWLPGEHFGYRQSVGFAGGATIFYSIALSTYARKAQECIAQT